jgi:hypothetical protein
MIVGVLISAVPVRDHGTETVFRELNNEAEIAPEKALS